MSRARAWTLAGLLDRWQARGIVPHVNPGRGGPPPLPTPPTVGRALTWFALTVVVLIAIVVTQVLLAGQSAPFIYAEF